MSYLDIKTAKYLCKQDERTQQPHSRMSCLSGNVNAIISCGKSFKYFRSFATFLYPKRVSKPNNTTHCTTGNVQTQKAHRRHDV